jgi:hypothetical protein
MKKFFLVAGIVFSIGPFLLIGDKVDAYRVQQHGYVVDMKIIDMPLSCLGHRKFMRVEYNKKIFFKKIGGSFCDSHAVGGVVRLKYLPGARNTLFPDESVISQFIAAGILVLVGVYCVYTGLKSDTQ